MARALVAIIVFAGLAASALWCIRRRTIPSAFSLGAFSGLWLIANNNVFEGPVLLTLNDQHGLTLMDLFSYVGTLIAVLVQLAGRPAGSAARRHTDGVDIAFRLALATATAALLFGGLAVSYFYQPNG